MSFIHSKADVETDEIGIGTNIWQFVVVMPGAVVGKECNICAHCLIEGGVIIGDRVTVKSGVQLWSGTTIESDAFIGPNVTFTNDMYPRSKVYSHEFCGVNVKKHASIGANSTLLPGITIGEFAMVGAGSVVVTDVPDYAVVIGNPAKIIRYISK